MKYVISAAAAACALMVAGTASAETYGTIGYTHISLDPVDLGAVTGRIGWTANDLIGFEAEAAMGVKDESVPGASLELDHSISVYAVGSHRFNDSLKGFVRVGYGSSKLSGTISGTTYSESDESFNYGVGGVVFFNEKNGVRFEYTGYSFKDFEDAETFSISFHHTF